MVGGRFRAHAPVRDAVLGRGPRRPLFLYREVYKTKTLVEDHEAMPACTRQVKGVTQLGDARLKAISEGAGSGRNRSRGR